MRQRHVIYRRRNAGRPRWEARILAGGSPAAAVGSGSAVVASTLAEARAAVSGRVCRDQAVEHLEHELDRGLYLRQALDGDATDRGDIARLLGACVTDRRVRSWLSRTVGPTPEEEVVAVACVPGDPVGWVLDQYEGAPLLVATKICNSRAWWSVLAEAAACPGRVHASLGELGLLDPEATVEDWLVKVPLGRVLVPAASVGGAALHPAA